MKWFDKKGYGAIKRDSGGDAFVGGGEVVGSAEGISLTEGERVQFDVAQGPKGPEAKNVRQIDMSDRA